MNCLKSFVATTLLLLASPNAFADNTLVVGDGQINGLGAREYNLSWLQCSLQEGEWVRRSDLNEALKIIDENTLQVQQTGHPQEGVTVVATFIFERASFAPRSIEQKVTSADGKQLVYSIRELTADGYSGHMERGGESKDVQGEASSTMLHGGAMGLPLALLDYQSAPLSFRASMISMDATYTVTAEWAGKETIEYDGQPIEIWWVDVEWLHEGLGDIYPPGPDASGGRYWVAPNPPEGFPYVLRYKTDTYAVEFVEEFCKG